VSIELYFDVHVTSLDTILIIIAILLIITISKYIYIYIYFDAHVTSLDTILIIIMIVVYNRIAIANWPKVY
jgi:hypothetical protein